MAAPRHVVQGYELNKYLQLAVLPNPVALDSASFSLVLPPCSSLYDALAVRMDLVIARLAVQGAFLLLKSHDSLYYLAARRDTSSTGEKSHPIDDVSWLGTTDADKSTWRWIVRQTMSINKLTTSDQDRMFSIPSLSSDERCSLLSSVVDEPHLSFYAGLPVTSKNDINIGALFVVDTAERIALSAVECQFLAATATKCVAALDYARRKEISDMTAKVNAQIDRFLNSSAIRAQTLEEPASLKGAMHSETKDTGEVENFYTVALQYHQSLDKIEETLLVDEDHPVSGDESIRLADAENDRDERLAEESARRNTASLGADLHDDEKSGEVGETIYRKVFRRACQCLQQALQIDGVLFTDGLVGHHGGLQPVAEPEQELERDIIRQPWKSPMDTAAIRRMQSREGDSMPNVPPPQHPGVVGETGGPSSRVFTSTEYQRGVYAERPAEILGTSYRSEDVAPVTVQLTESTLGLGRIDESFLQRLMDRHPLGGMWYFDSSAQTSFIVKDDSLFENDLPEETDRLVATFPGVRQLIFQPLTDPTSSKRLAGCFMWSNEDLPVFTAILDRLCLNGFLHVVESEISRLDARAAVKQQEAFVSSVSHELRTPLHGILGAIQLLSDGELEPFQRALADSIKSCGSTLHDTLTSVLSYAKINQFERRQQTFRERRPPDAIWALTDKQGVSAGPDRDYKGLYMCANIALLCEEIVGVLEAGKSYDKTSNSTGSGGSVLVVLNIDFEVNWCCYTEPGALRRIASNIIGNALKYTTEGSIAVTLRTSRQILDEKIISNDRSTGRMLTLTVEESGKGMSKPFLEDHLFVPFTQEDATSSRGVGLGISIVKSLVSLLSGEIAVRSEVGKGTEIKVSMPMRLCCTESEGTDNPTEEMNRMIESLRAQRLSFTIIGFPDAIRDSLLGYLHDWFHCRFMDDSKEDSQPDIIIVDEDDPNVSEEVKKTAKHYSQRGILLSIITTSSGLAKPMTEIEGYQQWERIPRPLGPNNVGKALLACVAKLKRLQNRVNDADQSCDDGDKAESPQTILQQSTHGALRHESTGPNEEKQILESHTIHAEKSHTNHRASDSPISSSGLRVLLVDDNALNLKLLKAFVKKSGYDDVQLAENGVEAVEAFRNCLMGFDVIFMDLSMPVMDGFEATRRIRRMEADRNQPCSSEQTKEEARRFPKTATIIALTGLASTHDENEAFDAGVDLYFTKPVKFNGLSKILKQCEEGALTARERKEH